MSYRSVLVGKLNLAGNHTFQRPLRGKCQLRLDYEYF